MSAIADWVKQVAWDGPPAALDKRIVAGHSNGGMYTSHTLADCRVDC